MSFIFRHKILTSIVASLFYVAAILPITESVWFAPEAADHKSTLYRYILHLLFGIVLVFVCTFIIHFIERLKNKDRFYQSWLRYSLLYGALLFVLFLLIFPGYWVWDEFWVLQSSHVYRLHSWQHIFTQVHYIFSLYLIPSSTGITIVQLATISSIVGYIIAWVRRLIPKKWPSLLIFLPFLSFPVLLGNFYTLRLHIYAYLLLLFLFGIFLLYRKGYTTKHPYTLFIGFSALVSVLAFWRSEGLIYVIALPFIAHRLGLLAELRQWRQKALRPLLALACAAALLFSAYLITKATEIPYYKLTATINPLSMMIHDELKGDKVDEAWAKVGTVLDLEVLKQYPSYIETPSIWLSNGRAVLRPNYENHLNEYYEGFAYIAANNPDLFIKYKSKTYLATNNLDVEDQAKGRNAWNAWTGWLTPYSLHGCTYFDAEHCGVLTEFDSMNMLSNPIDAGLREKILNILTVQTGSSFDTAVRLITWNVTPVVLLIMGVLIHALHQRRWVWFSIFGLLLAHTVLVFVTAPAIYFMYYFPIYLVGSVLSILYICLDLYRRQQSENNVSQPSILKEMKKTQPTVLVAIPAYNCEKQIPRVIAGFTPKVLDRVDKVIVIDNGSKDGTLKAAKRAAKELGSKKIEVWQNEKNYSLGGTHKVAFLAGEKLRTDYVAILHGDDQAKTIELLNLLDYAEQHPYTGAVLGCRFMRGSKLKGYDKKRIWGNRAINGIYSLVSLHRTRDLGSGLNLFRMKDLGDHRYLGFDDTLTFNIDLLLDYFRKNTRLGYVPITWSEEDQVSNARNFNIGATALKKLLLWRVRKERHTPKEASYYKSGKV